MVGAAWVLSDQRSGAGGFRCVPGSHKANFPQPPDLPETLVQEQVDLRAGDLLFFTEALTHGTLPWTEDHERRSLLFKYTPGSLAWSKPEEVRRQLLPFVDEVGDGLRVLLEPPYTGDRWPGTY
jgi:ectoine hydroxylase-related dioxygenase (phytanoyl-CoA dioxygenase family)